MGGSGRLKEGRGGGGCGVLLNGRLRETIFATFLVQMDEIISADGKKIDGKLFSIINGDEAPNLGVLEDGSLCYLEDGSLCYRNW